MTLVTDALDRIARRCRFDAPSSWLSATDDEAVSVRDDHLRESIDNILDRIDLPSPIGKQTTITGDGTESYTLPTDFRRITRDDFAVYETTTTRRVGVPVVSDGVWTHLNSIGTAGTFRYYQIEGYDENYTIHFFQNPGTSVEIVVSYVSNLWMASSSGTAGSTFTDAGDVLLLPRIPVELGAVWRFRRDKGLPYEDVLAECEAYIARLANDSRLRRNVYFGGPDLDVNVADYMNVPVPDFIPSS